MTNIHHHRTETIARTLLLALAVLLTFTASSALAQSDDSLPVVKQKAEELIKAQKFTEALPLIEKIVVAEPDNAHMQFNLAFALLGRASVTKDEAERKALRLRARSSFLKAKELGEQAPVLDALISGLPADGADTDPFSGKYSGKRFNEWRRSFIRTGRNLTTLC